MSSFDEIMGNIVTTAKKAANIAGKKTTEAVEIGKIKYKEQSVSREIAKAYAKLGALVYESETKGDDLSAVIAQTIEKITQLNLELDGLTQDFDVAVEVIKKPVNGDSAADIDFDIDLDDIKDMGEEVVEDVKATGEEIVEEVSEAVEDMKIVDEVDELVDDIKKNLE